MQKIRILSPQEIQLIAAGEVIENPGSIIKELVENGFDADASEITVHIKNAGVDYIQVSDNGFGMSKQDLNLACLPHATSKLSTVSDFYQTNNLLYGFRGEALAAIAGVCELKITTRMKESLFGYQIESTYGNISPIMQAPANQGTTVQVTGLFGSLPVRKKYLASKATLEKNILYLLTGLSLSCPEVALHYIKDGKMIFQPEKVNTFIQRAESFLTQDPSSFVVIDYSDEYITMNGLISGSEYGQYDRSKIFTLVNGRLIKQSKLTQSCLRAYQSEHFVKRYPELYLDIKVPADQIDVNVHPRKEEILFLYQKKIESIITKVIIDALEKRTKLLFSHTVFEKNDDSVNIKKGDIQEKIIPTINYKMQSLDTLCSSERNKQENFFSYQNSSNEKQNELPKITNLPDISKINQSDLLHQEISQEIPKKDDIKDIKQAKLFLDEEKKYIGVLDNTYLLFLSKKSILCIDQHALHEKILYLKYTVSEKLQNMEMTNQFLFNERYHFSDQEMIILKNERTVFASFGFDYECIDEAHIVMKAANYMIGKTELITFIQKICQILYDLSTESFEKKRELIQHEIRAMRACKDAIKAGDIVPDVLIQQLLKSALTVDSISLCPHGRPVFYEITVHQLERLFKRKN